MESQSQTYHFVKRPEALDLHWPVKDPVKDQLSFVHPSFVHVLGRVICVEAITMVFRRSSPAKGFPDYSRFRASLYGDDDSRCVSQGQQRPRCNVLIDTRDAEEVGACSFELQRSIAGRRGKAPRQLIILRCCGADFVHVSLVAARLWLSVICSCELYKAMVCYDTCIHAGP